ncbi:MAG: T9SS type A sorting domain-containing protein [Bacteroidetes bacterium]|nr:T9SS type A sorting domain-containing protein [Bacteroidota bacterium]
MITVCLTNIIGEVIYRIQITAAANQKQVQSIDLSGFQDGIYFMEVSSKDFKYLDKIIKQ